MEYNIHEKKGIKIVELIDIDNKIRSAQDFLNIIGNVPSAIILLNKEMIDESFFDLRSGLAGEILQKASNYLIKLGIIGDFSNYKSKSLRDLIYESNKNKQIVFVDSIDIAIEKFTN